MLQFEVAVVLTALLIGWDYLSLNSGSDRNRLRANSGIGRQSGGNLWHGLLDKISVNEGYFEAIFA